MREQAYFREHSANLRKLRDEGLVVLSAASKDAARAMVEHDPSVKSGTFRYELSEFSVFYGGEVKPAPRETKTEP